jgi:hypothetical protein
MGRQACLSKEKDISRAFRAARAAGIEARVDIAPDGKISIIPVTGQQGPSKTNEWDSVLDKSQTEIRP